MSSMVQCPNCKQMVTKDCDFCIFCGARIPAADSSAPDEPAHGGDAVKRCRNGHEFTDDSLVYCPICGLPFTSSAAAGSGSGWKCSCGHDNPADNAFCELCGRPKDAKPARRSAEAPAESEATVIPDGMYTPTADDLKPKRRNKV